MRPSRLARVAMESAFAAEGRGPAEFCPRLSTLDSRPSVFWLIDCTLNAKAWPNLSGKSRARAAFLERLNPVFTLSTHENVLPALRSSSGRSQPPGANHCVHISGTAGPRRQSGRRELRLPVHDLERGERRGPGGPDGRHQ